MAQLSSASQHFSGCSMLCLRIRGVVTASAHFPSTRVRRAPFVPQALTFAHPSTSQRYLPWSGFTPAQRRSLTASSISRAHPPPSSTPPTPIRRSILSRFLPASLSVNTSSTSSSTSFRKIVALAQPERRPLLTAIGLLLVSSSVSLSIPFTVGKLIDYFTTSNPVCRLP